jgi:hypothetical protein
MLFLNVIIPFTLLSIRRLRHNRVIIMLTSIGILFGMWQERVHIIIERSLMQLGGQYTPTAVDVSMLLGSIALFLALFLFLSSRIPTEKIEPLPHLSSTPPHSPRIAAIVGGGITLLITVIWLTATQWTDTAGHPGSSPQGLLFYTPICLVLTLLGAGLGIALNYLYITSKP